jgi:hypothetical protein
MRIQNPAGDPKTAIAMSLSVRSAPGERRTQAAHGPQRRHSGRRFQGFNRQQMSLQTCIIVYHLLPQSDSLWLRSAPQHIAICAARRVTQLVCTCIILYRRRPGGSRYKSQTSCSGEPPMGGDAGSALERQHAQWLAFLALLICSLVKERKKDRPPAMSRDGALGRSRSPSYQFLGFSATSC